MGLKGTKAQIRMAKGVNEFEADDEFEGEEAEQEYMSEEDLDLKKQTTKFNATRTLGGTLGGTTGALGIFKPSSQLGATYADT